MSEMNICYERFIEGAFSTNKLNLISRFGDPAGLADTDVFAEDCIEKVKAAVSYSMQIFKNYIIKNKDLPIEEFENMDIMTKNVINAKDKEEIYDLICDFKEKYMDKYVKFPWEI